MSKTIDIDDAIDVVQLECGKWIFVGGSVLNGKAYYRCSVCDATDVRLGINSAHPRSICPNCHSPMKGRVYRSGTSLNVL